MKWTCPLLLVQPSWQVVITFSSQHSCYYAAFLFILPIPCLAFLVEGLWAQTISTQSSLVEAGAVFAEQLLRSRNTIVVVAIQRNRVVGKCSCHRPCREAYSRRHQNDTIYWQDKLRSGLKDISKCLWNGLGLLSPSPRAGMFYLWGSCSSKTSPALHWAFHQGLLLMPRHTM